MLRLYFFLLANKEGQKSLAKQTKTHYSDGGVGHSNGVLGSAIVGDLSDVAVVAVGVVVDMLGPAVGEVDGVGALGIS